jgi:hypothetical protein
MTTSDLISFEEIDIRFIAIAHESDHGAGMIKLFNIEL